VQNVDKNVNNYENERYSLECSNKVGICYLYRGIDQLSKVKAYSIHTDQKFIYWECLARYKDKYEMEEIKKQCKKTIKVDNLVCGDNPGECKILAD
jgi:hypothetical protein